MLTSCWERREEQKVKTAASADATIDVHVRCPSVLNMGQDAPFVLVPPLRRTRQVPLENTNKEKGPPLLPLSLLLLSTDNDAELRRRSATQLSTKKPSTTKTKQKVIRKPGRHKTSQKKKYIGILQLTNERKDAKDKQRKQRREYVKEREKERQRSERKNHVIPAHVISISHFFRLPSPPRRLLTSARRLSGSRANQGRGSLHNHPPTHRPSRYGIGKSSSRDDDQSTNTSSEKDSDARRSK